MLYGISIEDLVLSQELAARLGSARFLGALTEGASGAVGAFGVGWRVGVSRRAQRQLRLRLTIKRLTITRLTIKGSAHNVSCA